MLRVCSYEESTHKVHAATKSSAAAGIEAFVPRGGSTAHNRSTVNCRTAYDARKACFGGDVSPLSSTYPLRSRKDTQFSAAESSSARPSSSFHRAIERVREQRRERVSKGQW